MCYTIEINLTREQLEKRFQTPLKKNSPYRPNKRVNAFSFPDVPVISSHNPDSIRLFTWGLIPFWVKTEEDAKNIRQKTFNAKAETITEKPSFRHAIKRNKCLVLTNGFYEWQHKGKEKIPHFIRLKDEEAVALAGLFDSWTNKDTGEILNTFTIITTAANPLMEKIHNTKKRMPVILGKDSEQSWIDPEIPLDKTLQYLKPFDERKMIATVEDRQLFSRKGDTIQGSLF